MCCFFFKKKSHLRDKRETLWAHLKFDAWLYALSFVHDEKFPTVKFGLHAIFSSISGT